MTSLHFDSIARSEHPMLAAHVAAIAGEPAPAGDKPSTRPGVTMVTTDTRARAGRLIRIGKGATSGVRMVGGRLFDFTYHEDDMAAARAAMIACGTAPGDPVAADPESLAVLDMATRLAASDITVLIDGPTGTGKEVLARYLHSRSARADKPFIAVNCAAVPESMLEALLFGHQKGAFTGAAQAGEGFFRAADGGTLLLDEIAEMPLALQAKLLRALQEGEVVPLGATRPVKVDVRIIACANRDLPLEVEEGRFRADLYYRLNVFPLALRPLCERRDDVAALAFALMLRHAPEDGRPRWIAADALALLTTHSWPGNIRELENVMQRALLLAGDQPLITCRHIIFDRPARLVGEARPMVTLPPVPPANALPPLPAMDEGTGGALSKVVQLSEAKVILETLDACNGSRVEAARRLGISERTLRYRLARYRAQNAGAGAA